MTQFEVTPGFDEATGKMSLTLKWDEPGGFSPAAGMRAIEGTQAVMSFGLSLLDNRVDSNTSNVGSLEARVAALEAAGV